MKRRKSPHPLQGAGLIRLIVKFRYEPKHRDEGGQKGRNQHSNCNADAPANFILHTRSSFTRF
nr:MAG TPA: hypothetical protein [Caudoviricetes sp.]